MWGLMLILAGSPMPAVSWHMTHDACQAQVQVERQHAAVTGREVLLAECRSYLKPRSHTVSGEVWVR